MGVSDKIIQPLSNWFGKPIPMGRAEVYYEVLVSFSDGVLEKALKEIKETWTAQTMPQPGVIKQICEKILVKDAPPKVESCVKARLDFFSCADKILKEPIGKTALREGWASSLVNEFMTGQKEFDDSDVVKFRNGQRAAKDAVRMLNPDKYPSDKALLSLWHTMRNTEQELLDKFRFLVA